MQPLPRRLLVYFTGPMDLSSHAAIIIGIFVGVVSTSVQSLGLTLQRKSHLLEEERPSQRPPYRRRRWQVGNLLSKSPGKKEVRRKLKLKKIGFYRSVWDCS
ncbi:hypothetical protein TWF217_002016 [Orbilia oligospora]|nr:hypothetical protein TWF217_002016 [Orbilia oligospora]